MLKTDLKRMENSHNRYQPDTEDNVFFCCACCFRERAQK